MKKSILALALCSCLVSSSFANAAVPKAGYSNISGNPFVCKFSNTANGIAYRMNTKKISSATVTMKMIGSKAVSVTIKKSKGTIKTKKYKVKNVAGYQYIDSRGRSIRCMTNASSCSTEIPFQYKANAKKTAVRIVGKSTYTGKLTVKTNEGEAGLKQSSSTIKVEKDKKFIVTLASDGFMPADVNFHTEKNGVTWYYAFNNATQGSNLTLKDVCVNN